MNKTLNLLTALALVALLPVGVHAKAKYERTVEDYPVPDVTLVDQDGQRVRLLDLLDTQDVPVFVDFIYGTCTTICPVLSAGYASFQRKVGTDAARLISISIDPEHDTPEVMSEYLRRYGARPGWSFLTGTRPDIDRVMRAFDAYVENKMSHYPITFLRGPGDEKWVRIYGLLGTTELITEFEKLAVE